MATGYKKRSLFNFLKFCRSLPASEDKAYMAVCGQEAVTTCLQSSSIQMTSLRPDTVPDTPATSSCASSDAGFSSVDWFAAVSNNDLRAVHHFLSRDLVDVNSRCPVNGWCALHISSWNGYVDLVRLLLESDACDVDLPGPGAITPLFLAVQRCHVDLVDLLVAADCDVTRRATLRMRGGSHVASDVSALHVAVQSGHVGVVRRLLAAGAPVDATMRAGALACLTPLHLAVETGNSDVIDLLIEAGSDVNGRTRASNVPSRASSSFRIVTTV